MTNFNEFLEEQTVESTPEIITAQEKQAARSIIALARGLRPGRIVDFTPQENTKSTGANVATAVTGQAKQEASLILKNNSKELVYADKQEDYLMITLINKQRFTKRTIAIEARGAMLLKRFI